MQNAVGVADGAIQFGLPIMRFDLSGERIPRQIHAVGDEFAGDGHPIDIRHAAKCAPNVPVAPLILPRYS